MLARFLSIPFPISLCLRVTTDLSLSVSLILFASRSPVSRSVHQLDNLSCILPVKISVSIYWYVCLSDPIFRSVGWSPVCLPFYQLVNLSYKMPDCLAALCLCICLSGLSMPVRHAVTGVIHRFFLLLPRFHCLPRVIKPHVLFRLQTTRQRSCRRCF